jgi:flagellar protein FlbB
VETETKKQEFGKFQWFFFVIFIPMIFTLTLVGVILSVAGFDVLGKAKSTLKEIPVVEKLFKEEEETAATSQDLKEEAQKEEINKLEETVEEQSVMITALEKDLTNKEKEVQTLTQEINSLEKQLEEIKKTETETDTQKKDIASLYDNMSSKKAAEIIPNLSQEDALLILTSLDDKQVADILAKMTVEDAVKYTGLLSANDE